MRCGLQVKDKNAYVEWNILVVEMVRARLWTYDNGKWQYIHTSTNLVLKPVKNQNSALLAFVRGFHR